MPRELLTQSLQSWVLGLTRGLLLAAVAVTAAAAKLAP